MESRRFYVVRGVTKHGSVTYNCPTPDWALRKLRDFEGARYREVSVTGPDGQPMTEADLIATGDVPGAAPSEETIPAAPKVTRQPAMA